MGLKVKNLFELEIFSKFKLVAGEKGLDKSIKGTEILDFEFVQGAGLDREQVFFGESIVLSSLLFAKDNQSLITDAIKRLHKMNISCFAYKPIFIKKLPDEALAYADSNNFPVLEFGGDEFFEDIIFAVQNRIREDSETTEKEIKIQEIIDRNIAQKEITKFARKLNPDFRRYIRAVYMTGDNFNGEKISLLLKRYSGEERVRRKTAICKYKDGCFIFLSQETDDSSRFDALLNDVFSVLGIDNDNIRCGCSFILRTETEFAKAVREAYWSCIVAELEESSQKYYEDMGIYRFIVPEINSESMREYMQEYLAPIMNDEADLLETAKTYILSRGSLEDTANKMFCHKNTVRYRLNKIHDMLDQRSNEKEFYENLAIAVRIYMLIEKKEQL